MQRPGSVPSDPRRDFPYLGSEQVPNRPSGLRHGTGCPKGLWLVWAGRIPFHEFFPTFGPARRAETVRLPPVREPIFDYRITNYSRSLNPNLFVAFMDEDAHTPDDWIPRTGRSLGHPGWGLVYHLALSVLHPDDFNVVLETGTNLGSTAIVAAQALKDSGRPGIVRTVELDPEIAAEAARRVQLAGVAGYVETSVGDSLEEIPKLLADVETLRIAFLDGNHFHDHVVTEFELIADHLSTDSLVIFDNTALIADDREDPRVNGALRTIVDIHGGHLVNLPICSWYTPGIAIWQRSPFENMEPPQPGSFDPES